jgi:hypothetical protein
MDHPGSSSEPGRECSSCSSRVGWSIRRFELGAAVGSATATSTSSLLAAQCSGVSGRPPPVSSFGSAPASSSKATAAGASGK